MADLATFSSKVEKLCKSEFVNKTKIKGNVMILPNNKSIFLKKSEVNSLALLRRKQMVEYKKYLSAE